MTSLKVVNFRRISVHVSVGPKHTVLCIGKMLFSYRKQPSHATRLFFAVKEISTTLCFKLSLTFPDSTIARKTACGRTKAKSIVTNVLAPKSVESITRDLTSGDDLQPSCIAVSTDASKWKNRKMFPICVQYFTVESGVRNYLILLSRMMNIPYQLLK